MPAPHDESVTGPVLRFAPSPNGRLHLGHAYSALLNARIADRMGGRCLLRIEDIDPVRSRPELIVAIEDDLAWLGLTYERPVRQQSGHLGFYRTALDRLIARGLAYPCFCSRGMIAARVAELAVQGRAVPRDPDGAPLYPGTCRSLSDEQARVRREEGTPHTWRLDMTRALESEPGPYAFHCFEAGQAGFATNASLNPTPRPSSFRCRAAEPRIHDWAPTDRVVDDSLSGGLHASGAPLRGRVHASGAPRNDGDAVSSGGLGPFDDAVPADPSRWGDAVIARRDVPTSYHLSVVLDDEAQGITHVVRGEDLLAATDLHVLLQRLLDLPSPAYHHHGLIRGGGGEKLAKSRGSESLGDLRARGVAAAEVREMLGF